MCAEYRYSRIQEGASSNLGLLIDVVAAIYSPDKGQSLNPLSFCQNIYVISFIRSLYFPELRWILDTITKYTLSGGLRKNNHILDIANLGMSG
ncbi:MAG: hypothetical protein WBD99_02500 [Thermodesulfobacteriota bacterium]